MKGDFVVKFLEAIKDTVVDVGISVSKVPYKGFRYSDFNRYEYKNRKNYVGFKNLERRGLIKDEGDDRFTFTKHGQDWIHRSIIKYFMLKSRGKWDKKWRVIIFDIPQELHKERVKFRQKLKSLGFFMLQKSVFIFPYFCKEEIGDICVRLGVSDYVDILVAESAGSQEKELLKVFNL